MWQPRQSCALAVTAAVMLAPAPAAVLTQLPHPFCTNVAGVHLLNPPFIGKSKATVRTGFFATVNKPDVEKLNSELHFDLFTLETNRPSRYFNYGSHVISQRHELTTNGWRHSKLHSYRSTLPSDVAIKACANVTALRKLLGEPQVTDGPPFLAVWSLFTVSSKNAVEALSVACFAERNDGVIESLEIRRGIAERAR
jgi:hypothetical protein